MAIGNGATAWLGDRYWLTAVLGGIIAIAGWSGYNTKSLTDLSADYHETKGAINASLPEIHKKLDRLLDAAEKRDKEQLAGKP